MRIFIVSKYVGLGNIGWINIRHYPVQVPSYGAERRSGTQMVGELLKYMPEKRNKVVPKTNG